MAWLPIKSKKPGAPESLFEVTHASFPNAQTQMLTERNAKEGVWRTVNKEKEDQYRSATARPAGDDNHQVTSGVGFGYDTTELEAALAKLYNKKSNLEEDLVSSSKQGKPAARSNNHGSNQIPETSFEKHQAQKMRGRLVTTGHY